MCDWLKSLNMEQYVPEFRDKDVDGELLLQMDGTKLKVHTHTHHLVIKSTINNSTLEREWSIF